MYVTYDFYSNTYGGTLVPNTDFDRYNLKAQNALDNYTLKPKETARLLDTHLGDHIRLVVCELIDNIYQEEKALQEALNADSAYFKGLESESVKDHTVKFSTKESATNRIQDDFAKQRKKIMSGLTITGLLYRGVS